jgi:hypothetical protein
VARRPEGQSVPDIYGLTDASPLLLASMAMLTDHGTSARCASSRRPLVAAVPGLPDASGRQIRVTATLPVQGRTSHLGASWR